MDLRGHRPGVAAACSLLARGRLALTVDDLPLTLTGLTWRKRMNILLGGAQKLLQPPFRLGWPLILQIEPTNTCNLRCPACATGAGLVTRKPALMAWDTYTRIIDEMKPYACIVFFWSWGEPFLHPDACRMIRHAKDQGLAVHSSTNGHCFATPDRAQALVASGIDSLVFAVDGLDPETYAAYRRGGDFATVLSSIRNVVRARDAAGTARPFLALRFIVMKHNEHQLAGVEAFARDLGVDAVTWRTPILARGDRQEVAGLAPDAPAYRRDALPADPQPCNRPFANLTVFSGGELVFCENDYNAGSVIGIAGQESLRAAWSAPRARRMLRDFRLGDHTPSFCAACEFRNSRKPTFNVTTKLLRGESC